MKRILLAIGLVLFITLVLGFIAPKEYVAVRRIDIDAPKAFVYEQIKSLEDLHTWSYPMFQDSTMDIHYEGTPGTVGSSARWTRRLSMKEGAEEIIRVVPLSRMETRIRTIRPWESLSHSFYYLEGQGEKCSIEWKFEGHSPFPFNIRNLFINMEFTQGELHEQSLEQLKIQVERDYVKQKLGIRFEKSSKAAAAVMKHTIAANVLPESFIFGKSAHKSHRINNNSLSPRIFLFKQTPLDSLTIGVVVQSGHSIDSTVLDSVKFDHNRQLVVDYLGDYQGIMALCKSVESYIQGEGWNQLWPVELTYATNPLNEADTSKWVTQIRYRLTTE